MRLTEIPKPPHHHHISGYRQMEKLDWWNIMCRSGICSDLVLVGKDFKYCQVQSKFKMQASGLAKPFSLLLIKPCWLLSMCVKKSRHASAPQSKPSILIQHINPAKCQGNTDNVTYSPHAVAIAEKANYLTHQTWPKDVLWPYQFNSFY